MTTAPPMIEDDTDHTHLLELAKLQVENARLRQDLLELVDLGGREQFSLRELRRQPHTPLTPTVPHSW